jgi:15-cis-phytoene synthase
MSPFLQRFRFTNAGTTSFYYSFVFLPPAKRRAIEAVYAFARRADDAADGGLARAEAAEALARCRGDLEACYRNPGSDSPEPGHRPELAALAEAIARFNIGKRHFEDLLLGVQMDLDGTRYVTFDDLRLYCYRVASTIGLISIEIFGYSNPRSRDYAVNLGTALQLVNILRDLRQDVLRGRVYFPEEDLERFHVRPQELVGGGDAGRLSELIEFEVQRARSYFKLARQALPDEDRRSMLPAEIMAAIYWRLFARIQQGFRPLNQRLKLSRALKLWTAFSVFLGVEWYRDP